MAPQKALAGHSLYRPRIPPTYSFLNERLAKPYGIPRIYGNRFREAELPRDSQRGGLLRQGSILTVTSYATRTSRVIRGTSRWRELEAGRTVDAAGELPDGSNIAGVEGLGTRPSNKKIDIAIA